MSKIDPEVLKKLDESLDAKTATPEGVEIPRETIEKLDSEDFSFSKMGDNLWPSAKQFASDITYPILHPVDTFNSLTDLANGLYHQSVKSASNALPPNIVERFNRAQNKLVEENFLGSGLLVDKTPVKRKDMRYKNIDKGEKNECK